MLRQHASEPPQGVYMTLRSNWGCSSDLMIAESATNVSNSHKHAKQSYTHGSPIHHRTAKNLAALSHPMPPYVRRPPFARGRTVSLKCSS
jgi:hypothetical protein